MKVIGIIPARLESTRLPGKALIDIEGLPMVVHVLKRAQLSKSLSDVFVATDSLEIKKAVEAHDGKAVMTSRDHQTGTDRIAEAARDLQADVIVNVQGDEPLLDPLNIDRVIEPFTREPDLQVAAPVTRYGIKQSPSDIKAVLNLNNDIMYCSRADLPADARCPVPSMWKMSFIIPMRKKFLLEFASWGPSPLEKIEFIEHLRIIEHGVKFRAVPVESARVSVDTPDDLKKILEEFQSDTVKFRYMK